MGQDVVGLGVGGDPIDGLREVARLHPGARAGPAQAVVQARLDRLVEVAVLAAVFIEKALEPEQADHPDRKVERRHARQPAEPQPRQAEAGQAVDGERQQEQQGQ